MRPLAPDTVPDPAGPPSTAGPAGTVRIPAVLPLLTAHLVVALLALVVIGGATRVMEAGLACPDWPLCYGSLLPGRQMNVQVFLEWFHRLDAFLVGLALLALNVVSFVHRSSLPRWVPPAAALSLVLVAAQGALGALTVTHLLEASTVTAHLVTALALLLLLSALHQGLEARLQVETLSPAPLPGWWLPLVLLTTSLLLAQCLLGGSMASRWAAERCLSVGDGCRWLLFHRQGAWPAAGALVLQAMACLALPRGHRSLKAFSAAAALLVPLQVALGVLTLRLQLSAPAVTVTHQFVAALLIALSGAAIGRSLVILPRPTESFLFPQVRHG